MTDLRALRDSLESVQAELKEARELLATPLDVAQVNREVGAALFKLAEERAELTATLRGIRGLRESVEETRLWCLALKGRRSTGELRGALELMAVIALGSAYLWMGAQLGVWLERVGAPWPFSLCLAVLSCPVAFTAVAGLARWFGKERWC